MGQRVRLTALTLRNHLFLDQTAWTRCSGRDPAVRHYLTNSAGGAVWFEKERLEAIGDVPWGQRRSTEAIRGTGTNAHMNEVGSRIFQCCCEGLHEAIGIVGECSAGIAAG